MKKGQANNSKRHRFIDDVVVEFTKPSSPKGSSILSSKNGYTVLSTQDDNEDDSHDFIDEEIGRIVCFAFRRMNDSARRHWLNMATNCVSHYIHCELCFFNKDYTDFESVIVTRETKFAVLGKNQMDRFDTKTNQVLWDFVYVRLTMEQIGRMRQSIKRIVNEEQHVRFSRGAIFCFFCNCFCCNTRTCSEVTMQILSDTLGIHIPNKLKYSPSDVYSYLVRYNNDSHSSDAQMVIQPQLDNITPKNINSQALLASKTPSGDSMRFASPTNNNNN